MKKIPAEIKSYIDEIEEEEKRSDCQKLAEIMQRATLDNGRMWGQRMVGFGQYHYKYASGTEGDFLLTGFGSRKNDLSIYINSGFEVHTDLMEKLGKFKTGSACLYVKKLSDIDLNVLEELIISSVKIMKEKYPD